MARTQKQKVIAHRLDGTLLKGTTGDFSPRRKTFTVASEEGSTKIKLADLKGLFFVKEFTGLTGYRERKGFFNDSTKGHKVMVEFVDGEIIFGYTASLSERGVGFYMLPGDPDCNNIKVFVVYAATKRVKLKDPPASEKVPTASGSGKE